jgi:hypothetical protein
MSQEKITIRVDCDLLIWGWKSKHIPSNPSQPYYTVTRVIGFRVERDGNYELYEFKEPLTIKQFAKLCKHIKSEISLCPVSYYECDVEIFKYVKKSD